MRSHETSDREPAVFRRCARCGTWKPDVEFHNSVTSQFSYCRHCRRDYDRRYYRERGKGARGRRQRARRSAALAWMAEVKRGIPCADCGQTFPSPLMHWDHLPGHTKLDAVSSLLRSRVRRLVLEELAKCEFVCANCHAVCTSRRRRGV